MIKTTENPLKICFAVYKRYGGGAERALTELASVLAEMGHEITVIQKTKTEWEYPISEKVKTYTLEAPKSRVMRRLKLGQLEHFRMFYQKVREIDPDVLVPYLAWAEEFCFWAAKLGRRKLIYTIRCNPALEPEKKKHRIFRNIRCFFSDKIYVQNEAEASYFPPFMQKKIFVLPNITRQDFFVSVRPPKREIRHFVNAGRLTPQKNQQMLIRAFSRLAGRFPEKQLRLSLYGQGPLLRELEALIRQTGMQEHIFLMGFSRDLAAEYAGADAFVLASDFEGQPNVLMEAMAAGLPCISTDCPTGPAELIEDGVNGLLIPCGDEESLAAALERFVTEPSAAAQMGKRAREHMEALCDREQIGQTFIKQCMELRISRSKRARR